MSNTTEEVTMSDETTEATEEERRIAAEMGGEPDADVGEGNGTQERRSLADLAADEPEAPEEPEQYTLFGTAPKVNSQIRGARVSSSHVSFKAKSQQLPGQFDMSEVVELRVLARVDKVTIASKHDADGNVVETKRTHQLTAMSVEQLGEVDDSFTKVDGR